MVRSPYPWLEPYDPRQKMTDEEILHLKVPFDKSILIAANIEFSPKVLDAGETMVLLNLPRPWILLCGQEKWPTEIEIATYKVVDRKEFCECSLTAGSFQLDETLVKCTPEINSEADGHFKSYFAINKIIFDYLQAKRDVQLDSTVVQVLVL